MNRITSDFFLISVQANKSHATIDNAVANKQRARLIEAGA
jgi:hypothetical protein